MKALLVSLILRGFLESKISTMEFAQLTEEMALLIRSYPQNSTSGRKRTGAACRRKITTIICFVTVYTVALCGCVTTFTVVPLQYRPRSGYHSIPSSEMSTLSKLSNNQIEKGQSISLLNSVRGEGDKSTQIPSSVDGATNISTSISVAGSVATTVDGTTGGGMVPPFSVTLDNAAAYSYKEAIQRTIAWVSAALIFGSSLWVFGTPQMGEEFFAGYLVEQSLSIDNLFVFLLLFEYFQIPLQYQDRVLNWGIYGAIVMRAVMIGLGVSVLESFRGVLLVFAAILVYGSAKFFIGLSSEDDDEEDPKDNQIIQFAQKLFQSTDKLDGDRFFTIQDGVRMATPLFICMVAVELSDVVFAVDSIPAVFGVTEVCYLCISMRN